jgi:hypothetical protein
MWGPMVSVELSRTVKRSAWRISADRRRLGWWKNLKKRPDQSKRVPQCIRSIHFLIEKSLEGKNNEQIKCNILDNRKDKRKKVLIFVVSDLLW